VSVFKKNSVVKSLDLNEPVRKNETAYLYECPKKRKTIIEELINFILKVRMLFISFSYGCE
jgi:hypothetical protein